MNKNLLLAVLAVSMIPSLFIIGGGITGMAVSDTSTVAQPIAVPADNILSSAPVVLFFTVAIILLIIAIVYTIILFRTEKSVKKTSKKLELLNRFKAKISKVNSAKLTDDQIGKYIVAIVGIVAVVAILIMVLG
jgi:hypothetical protein